MGKFKRLKSKPKVEKRFVSLRSLYTLLIKNISKLESIPNEVFQIELHEHSHDYKEYVREYLIIFSDRSAYLVGYENIIVEEDDSAQAESMELYYCLDYYQERRHNVPALKVMEKLEKVLENI
jgi:hypothetical protein